MKRNIRQEFVDEVSKRAKQRRDITLYQHFEGMGDGEPTRCKRTEGIYMAGVRDAVDLIISMTDDRTLNEARWRLTTAEGVVVPFCSPDDKGYLDTPGLIALFHDAINT